MSPETEKPKVEVLKLPNQLAWRGLLEFYRDVLREQINDIEDVDLLNDENTELPPFLAKKLSPTAYSENYYALEILGDLLNGKWLNSYERTLIMNRDYSNTEEDFINSKKAWERVSGYLKDHDALLRDTNEICEKNDFVMWEKPQDFMPHNPNLQPQLLSDI